MQIYLLITTTVFFLTLALVSWFLKNRIKTPVDFVCAGRKLGLPMSTTTLYASWFCGGLVLGAAGAAYGGGFTATIADPFGAGFVLILAGLLVFRPMRRMGVLTVVDFYERRFNKTVGFLASIGQMVAYIGWLGALLVASGFVLHTLLGLNMLLSITLAALVVIIYTTLSGMWGVAVNDFIQMIIIVSGLLLLFVVVLNVFGGWSGFTASVPDHFFDLWPRNGNLIIWLAYLSMFLSLGLGCLPEQVLVQRGASAKNENVAVWGGYLAGLLYLTVGLIPPLLGMAASVILPDLADPEMSVLVLAERYLHPVGIAILFASLMAAIVSSAAAASLAPASVLGENVFRLIKPKASGEQSLLMTRLMLPVVVIVSGVLAVRVQAVYHLMVDAFTIMLVSLVVPLLGGLYWKKANVPGAMGAIISGFLVWAFLYTFQPEFLGGGTEGIFGLITSLTTLVVVSLATQNKDQAKPLLDMNGRPLHARDMIGFVSPVSKQTDIEECGDKIRA